MLLYCCLMCCVVYLLSVVFSCPHIPLYTHFAVSCYYFLCFPHWDSWGLFPTLLITKFPRAPPQSVPANIKGTGSRTLWICKCKLCWWSCSQLFRNQKCHQVLVIAYVLFLQAMHCGLLDIIRRIKHTPTFSISKLAPPTDGLNPWMY